MAGQVVNTPEETIRWAKRARSVFAVPKPAKFVACGCAECNDHQQTLSAADVETFTLSDLGHSALNPLNFATPAGLKYYFPALVRLTLQYAEEEILQALLSVLRDGRGGINPFWESNTAGQRNFVADFLGHIIETHAGELDLAGVTDEVLWAYERWSQDSRSESVQ
ncbi:MAG: hypothetical protein V7703_12005 [Hyphomicrobiales bacterium]